MNCPGSGLNPMHKHGNDGTCAFCHQIRPLRGGVVKPHKQLK